MAESSGSLIEVTAPSRLQITKWKVRKGSKVAQGAVLGFYKLINSDDPENRDKIQHEKEIGTQLSSPDNQLHKLKASHVGTVFEIVAEEGQEIVEGSVVVQIKGCSHPTVMKDMCADCGADLRTEMGVSGCRKENVSATVAMVHSIPELIVSEEQALELGRADEIRLIKTRKLVLLVDLDQTLIHTTNDNIPPNLKGIHHFQLWQGMNLLWYHTRIRPHTQQFLENISKLYELHICTFGVRMYAHTIARFIDPAGKFFSHRILSRDECFNAMSKTANLKALFPCGDSMVCIIDDREDVWNFAPNLIHVKPYRFFQGTADINAPPGLSKKENDSKPITRHVRKVSTNSNSPEKSKGMSSGSKDKGKASKNVEKEKKAVEETILPKCRLADEEEENDGVESVSKDEDSNTLSKEPDTIMANKDNTDDSTSQREQKDAEDPSKDSIKQETKDTVNSEDAVSGKDAASSEGAVGAKDAASSEGAKDAASSEGAVGAKDAASSEGAVGSKNAASSEGAVGAKDAASSEGAVGAKDAASSEGAVGAKDAASSEGAVGSKDAASSEGAVGSKDAASSEGAVGAKDAASSEGAVGSKDAASSEGAVGSKDAVELKSDEEDESNSEDLEGLSEDSSMSGMSLCDNSSMNATSKNDDSNIDDNDDDDDDDNEDKMIEWEDEDDYLYYLEQILQRVHTAYFAISDQLNAEGKASEINLDLKAIIPYVKRKVLKGCNICFSGIIPLNTPMVKSRAYNVAISLGANIHETFVPYSSSKKLNYTTHLIANKTGTSKVHAAQRARKVTIVSLDWLWSCAERWERVDERLFLLKDKDCLDSDNGRSSPEIQKVPKSVLRKRKCGNDNQGHSRGDTYSGGSKMKKTGGNNSPGKPLEDEIFVDAIDNEDSRDDNNNNNNEDNDNDDDVKKLKRTGSHYNPLYSFSDEERASMDKELEELMDEDDSSDSDEQEAEAQLRKQVLSERRCDTSSEDSLSGEFPHGWKSKKWSKRRLSKKKTSVKRDESIDGEDSEASISEKYEKSIEIFAAHESDSSNEESDCESVGSIDEEIAEAVEKEFLAR